MMFLLSTPNHYSLEPGDMVIMDEVHKIKNPKAKRTVVAVSIKARRKVLLTGTPITNRPIELQPIAGYLDYDSFGSFF